MVTAAAKNTPMTSIYQNETQDQPSTFFRDMGESYQQFLNVGSNLVGIYAGGKFGAEIGFNVAKSVLDSIGAECKSYENTNLSSWSMTVENYIPCGGTWGASPLATTALIFASVLGIGVGWEIGQKTLSVFSNSLKPLIMSLAKSSDFVLNSARLTVKKTVPYSKEPKSNPSDSDAWKLIFGVTSISASALCLMLSLHSLKDSYATAGKSYKDSLFNHQVMQLESAVAKVAGAMCLGVYGVRASSYVAEQFYHAGAGLKSFVKGKFSKKD